MMLLSLAVTLTLASLCISNDDEQRLVRMAPRVLDLYQMHFEEEQESCFVENKYLLGIDRAIKQTHCQDLDGFQCRHNDDCFNDRPLQGRFVAMFHGVRGSGKSSLIERLCHYEAGVLSSDKTQTTSLHLVDDEVYVFDTPGITSKTTSSIDQVVDWQEIGPVHRIYLVLDPTNSESFAGLQSDIALLKMAYGNVRPTLIVNKCDQFDDVEDFQHDIVTMLKESGMADHHILFVSATTCITQLVHDLRDAAQNEPLQVVFNPPDNCRLKQYYDNLPTVDNKLKKKSFPDQFRSLGQHVWWLNAITNIYEQFISTRQSTTNIGDHALTVMSGVSTGTSFAAIAFPPLLAVSVGTSLVGVAGKRAITEVAHDIRQVYGPLLELKELQADLLRLFC